MFALYRFSCIVLQEDFNLLLCEILLKLRLKLELKGGHKVIQKIIRGVLALAGASAGVGYGLVLAKNPRFLEMLGETRAFGFMSFFFPILFGILLGIIAYIFAPMLMRFGVRLSKYIEKELEKVPSHQIAIGVAGLIPGLFIAYLISNLYKIIPIAFLGEALSVVTYIFLGYLGINLALRNFSEISRLPDLFRKSGQGNLAGQLSSKNYEGSRPKILDTSVIIDGRIADITKTGFVEGPLVIPEFVLEELRHIADSSDGLKRNRGRRGLDILKTIQNGEKVEVQISDADFEDVAEVDIKLLKLAQKIGGMVVTNDYNLNKVAALQGVDVLNINELANAVKSVVLPGEEMVVTVVKEGKEFNQGVAYLDDGTMIVIEGGKRFMSQSKNVRVTSVLQTAAGRMIFAKPL